MSIAHLTSVVEALRDRVEKLEAVVDCSDEVRDKATFVSVDGKNVWASYDEAREELGR
jgi:hypothetical protein